MNETTKAAQIVTALAGTHEGYEPPDIDQRIASWAGGAPDEEVAWLLSMAKMVAADPMAQALYLAHVADDTGGFRRIKDWAYLVAVEFVGSRGGKQRQRSMVESYRTDWGRQSARDGVALALWPHLSKDVPGIVSRSTDFKCGKQAYFRVRSAVESRATDLIADFRFALKWARGDAYSYDHVHRWEAVTGRQWEHGQPRV